MGKSNLLRSRKAASDLDQPAVKVTCFTICGAGAEGTFGV
jgi:hypothetical protein